MTFRPSRFDGVICFGGCDWWYHNHGHYDLQMCRELSEIVPVLYVNSLGIRVPEVSEGTMFVKRILRKLASFRRGFVRIHDRFAVMSPISVPGRAALPLSRRLLVPQIGAGAKRMGIERPLVWVTCPPGVETVPSLRPAGVVYERTDRWESFPEADREMILSCHRQLQELADLTLFCSTLLYDEEAGQCRNAAYLDHGVDFPRFERAGRGDCAEPADVSALAPPRVGFIGSIDSLTFDPDLFEAVARAMTDVSFVLVGSCTISGNWTELPNVSLLGQKPYEEVPAYMASCDVLIMPWNRSEWVRACNPVKLKEYLAVGRPVVSTDFAELGQYEGLVHVAEGAEEFVQAIREVLDRPDDPERLRARVRHHTWPDKTRAMLNHLAERGIEPVSSPSSLAAARAAASE